MCHSRPGLDENVYPRLELLAYKNKNQKLFFPRFSNDSANAVLFFSPGVARRRRKFVPVESYLFLTKKKKHGYANLYRNDGECAG